MRWTSPLSGAFSALLILLLTPLDFATANRDKVRLRLFRTIDVGRRPYSIALTPDGRELYVALVEDNALSAIDTHAGREINRLPVCQTPWVVKVSPDGANVFSGCNKVLAILSTRTKAITPVKIPGRITDLAITSDSKTIFIAADWAGLLSMDIATYRTKVVDSAVKPFSLALTPDGKSLYVNYQHGGPGGRSGHDALAKFDVNSGSLLHVVTGLPNVGGPIAISPDGKRLWSNTTDACLSRIYDHAGCPVVPAGLIRVFELPTHRILRELPWVRSSVPARLAFSPDGQFMAVAGHGPLLFDASGFEVVASLPELNSTDWLFAPDGKHAYIALWENQVGFIEIASPDVQFIAK